MLSLAEFLNQLPPEDLFPVTEPVNLDYHPTVLVLELEKRKRFPVLHLGNRSAETPTPSTWHDVGADLHGRPAGGS